MKAFTHVTGILDLIGDYAGSTQPDGTVFVLRFTVTKKGSLAKRIRVYRTVNGIICRGRLTRTNNYFLLKSESWVPNRYSVNNTQMALARALTEYSEKPQAVNGNFFAVYPPDFPFLVGLDKTVQKLINLWDEHMKPFNYSICHFTPECHVCGECVDYPRSLNKDKII